MQQNSSTPRQSQSLLKKSATIADKKSNTINTRRSEYGQNNYMSQIDVQLQKKSRKIIQQAKKQLDLVIQQLDSKIRRRLEINQSRFIYAYRNHLTKVTDQLKRMKQNQQSFEQRFSNDKAIAHLGKLCSFFRQQSMRLHTQLQNALTQSQVYKRKCQILQSEIQSKNKSYKNLLSNLKSFQTSKATLQHQNQTKQKIIQQLSSIANPNSEPRNQLSGRSYGGGGYGFNGRRSENKMRQKQLIYFDANTNTNANTKVKANVRVNDNGNKIRNQSLEVRRSGTVENVGQLLSNIQEKESCIYITMENQNQNQVLEQFNLQQKQKQLNKQAQQNKNQELAIIEYDIYNKFCQLVNNARQKILNQQKIVQANITSTTARNSKQIIKSEQKIEQLCRLIFPNIQINRTTGIQKLNFKPLGHHASQNKNKNYHTMSNLNPTPKTPQKRLQSDHKHKTTSNLSSQIMQKLKKQYDYKHDHEHDYEYDTNQNTKINSYRKLKVKDRKQSDRLEQRVQCNNLVLRVGRSGTNDRGNAMTDEKRVKTEGQVHKPKQISARTQKPSTQQQLFPVQSNLLIQTLRQKSQKKINEVFKRKSTKPANHTNKNHALLTQFYNSSRNYQKDKKILIN